MKVFPFMQGINHITLQHAPHNDSSPEPPRIIRRNWTAAPLSKCRYYVSGKRKTRSLNSAAHLGIRTY